MTVELFIANANDAPTGPTGGASVVLGGYHGGMGGVGFPIAIARLPGSTGDASALYEELHRTITENVKRLAKGKAYVSVIEEYLENAREDGAGHEAEISFGFKDGSGACNMSMDACMHWFALFVSALDRGDPSPLEEIAARHGFRIVDPPEPLGSLLGTCATPLVELRKRLFSTGTHDGAPYITSDETDEDAIEIEDLTPKERVKIETALKQQRCECKVCIALRDPSTKLKVAKAPKVQKPPKLGVRTTLHDGTIRNVNDTRCTELPAGVFAPPELETLNVTAPITGLPDAIVKLRALRRLGLSNTKMTRLPPVLGRMPWLREVSLFHVPLETPADLAVLPWLKNLLVRGAKSIVPRIEEFPFEQLTALEDLTLDELGLPALPERVGLLTELRTLGLRYNALTTLPASVAALGKLRRLVLDDNDFRQLPRCIGRLAALEHLSIGDKLETIPDDALPATLKSLSVRGPALASIPDAIGELTALESLGLHGEALRSVPDAIGKLLALKELSLTRTGIDRVPPAIRRLTRLTFLDLEDCRAVTELPSFIGELTALESLRIKDTAVTSLPESMRTLSKLRSLSLSAGVFPLPEWIGELPALEEIHAYRVALPPGEKTRLAKLLPRVSIDN